MNNPLLGSIPKWVFALGVIVALLIPTGILISQQLDVGESETTSVTIHNHWIYNKILDRRGCQMDIVHEVKSTSYWYKSWINIPPNDVRYLVMTYYIFTKPLIDKIEFLPEIFAPWPPVDQDLIQKIKQSDLSVIVPYMPSGGDIGVYDVVVVYGPIDVFDGKIGATLIVVVFFSAPEYRSWSISSAEVVLSNLVIWFEEIREKPEFPKAAVSIETEVTSSPPALPD